MANIIALFPGSFKPPHKGHFSVIQKMAEIPNVSKVSVLISNPKVAIRSSLSAEQAAEIFNIYSKAANFQSEVEFIVSPVPSPVGAVYDYIQKEPFEPNTKIVLFTSSKDADRFTDEKLAIYAAKNPSSPQVVSQIMDATKNEEGEDVGATAMRNIMSSEESAEQKASKLVRFMPSNLSDKDKEQVLSILLPELFMESKGKKKMNNNNEEKILREYIRAVLKKKLNEASIEDTPTRSTGLNKLVAVLKIILPSLESSYKALTTDKAQRDSFRKYIIKAYLDTLAPQDVLADMPMMESMDYAHELNEEDVDAEVAGLQGKKIDLDDPFGEKAEEEEQKKKEKEEKKQDKLKLAAEPEASKPFPTITGLDPTGRDAAIEVYKKTADAIIRSYRTLHNQQDQKIFKDYLITNVLLYMDQYESVIATDIPDVTTPEYEKQKADIARFSAAPAPEAAPAPVAEGKLSEQILNQLKKLNII